jgi:hypothetical protein
MYREVVRAHRLRRLEGISRHGRFLQYPNSNIGCQYNRNSIPSSINLLPLWPYVPHCLQVYVKVFDRCGCSCCSALSQAHIVRCTFNASGVRCGFPPSSSKHFPRNKIFSIIHTTSSLYALVVAPAQATRRHPVPAMNRTFASSTCPPSAD